MKKLYYLFFLIGLLLISCEQSTDLLQNKLVEDGIQEGVILSNEGYLIFKDQESYYRISSLLDKMSDNEFESWEKKIGFQSAQSFLSLVNKQIENLKTLEDLEFLKQKYSDKLVFEDDNSVRLTFYATAWDRILTVDGVMKIEDKLFKFEKDRELIILNGELADLTNINLLIKDSKRVCEFYPLKEINKTTLKSLQWGTLLSDMISTGNSIGDSRLSYSLQLISFNYSGYGITNPPVYYTEAGFEFKLNLQQQRKGLFGWYNNETMYYFNDVSQHLEYYIPHLIGGIWIPNLIVSDDSFPDTSWGETSYGCTYSFHYYYFVEEDEWSFVEPQIYDFTCKFWSRGIGVENKIDMSYSNI